MTKTNKTTKTALHACECSLWEFDLDVDRDDDYNTGCTAMTHRTFAQGHDAKLVGFMVRADLAGHDISRRDGGMLTTFGGAVDAASKVSTALALKAEVQMVAAIRRLKGKSIKIEKTPKAERKLAEVAKVVEAPKPTTREARIKVGRWTYDATIELATGIATYRTRLGATHMVDAGAFSEI